MNILKNIKLMIQLFVFDIQQNVVKDIYLHNLLNIKEQECTLFNLSYLLPFFSQLN
jgi:hypothetical protein